MPSLRGKKLVQWLQTIIKTAEGSVVDLTAVTKIYKEEAGPSPMSADLFLTLLCRLFADAARHEDGNRTYLLGARWITNAEVDNILLEEMTTELRAIELARIEAMDVEAKKVRMQMAKRGDEVSSFLLTTGLWKASQEKNGMQNGAAAKAVAGEQIMRKDSTLSVDGNNIDSDYDEDPDDYYTTDEHLSYMYQNWLDVQAEFEDAYDKVCLGKGVIVREWVEQVLITDSESRMDPFGVHVAFCSSTTAALLKDEPEVSATVMAMIMTSVFPDIEWKAEGDDPPLLCGVRWRNLDSAVACRTLSVCNCTGKVQKEVRGRLTTQFTISTNRPYSLTSYSTSPIHVEPGFGCKCFLSLTTRQRPAFKASWTCTKKSGRDTTRQTSSFTATNSLMSYSRRFAKLAKSTSSTTSSSSTASSSGPPSMFRRLKK